MMSDHRAIVTDGYNASHMPGLPRSEIESIAYDNLATADPSSARWGPFAHGDILDTVNLTRTLSKHRPEKTIYFADMAHGGESLDGHSKYYRINVRVSVAGNSSLMDACRQLGAAKVIFFALINSVLYASLLVIIVVQHGRENVVRFTNRSYRPTMAATFASLFVLAGLGSATNGMSGLESLAWGAGRLSIFTEIYSVSGAGLGDAGKRRTKFEFRWLPPSPNSD